ncbi:MAG TPA: YihY/virulence factor BrkB family protein [Pontiella sp.]|nr:YihY/virulence factor BrkB family protein [Pontiella sp.]
MASKVTDQIKRFLHFLQHDLWRIDLVHASRLRAFGVEALRVTHLVLKGVKEDNCKLHAAALTFATLMALVPLLAIVFSISSAIGFTTAKDWLMGQAAAMPDILPFVEKLIDVVENVDLAGVSSVGGVLLLYVVFKLLSGIEESFNQIWGVQSSRSLADKVRNYLSVLVVAPALMLVSAAATPVIMAFLESMYWLGPVLKIMIRLAPVFVLSLAFVAIFLFLPNTQVSFRAAFSGAIVSAVLATILQILMIKAGIGVTKLGKIYGTFAYVPIFLFWLHMSWTILLFGSELAFAIQNRNTYAEEQASVRASVISRLWVAFSVMQEAVRVFEGPAASLDTGKYARENNIPVRLMNEVVEVLTRASLLGACTGDGQQGYVLLQAPEHVSAKRIYDLMLTDGAAPEDLGLVKVEITEQVLATANISLDESLDPITLRKFFDEKK